MIPSNVVTENLSRNVGQFVSFKLDSQDYAFPIEQIQEIVIVEKITKTPQVPDYVEGVTNLRGSIIPIINLRRLFGMESKPIDCDTRTIVVNVGTRTIGCSVDTVTQVVRIPENAIQAPPETVIGHGAGYIAGFARIQANLIVILDVDRLLEPHNLSQVSGAAIQDQIKQNP